VTLLERVRRRLGGGRDPLRQALDGLELPVDPRVLCLGAAHDLERRYGGAVIVADEPPAAARFDLVVIDVEPELMPRAFEDWLPRLRRDSLQPGGVVAARFVSDLAAAYRGPRALPPGGAEATGAFLKRCFGRLRIDQRALAGAGRRLGGWNVLGLEDVGEGIAWAVLRVPPRRAESGGGPAAEPSRAKAKPEPFAEEVLRLAVEGPRIALDLVGDGEGCSPRCAGHTAKWGDWARTAFHGTLPVGGPLETAAAELGITSGGGTEVVVPGVALALVVVPDSAAAYLDAIGAKSRNMLRKLEREGYRTGPLDYNAHLDDLHAINTSKPVRSGGPMTEAYLQPLKPIGELVDACPRHRSVYVAAFRGERALGYARLVLVNELAVIDQILGHADALPHGVMNGLVRELVDVARDAGCVRAINYLTLRSSTASLDRFKRSVGFEAHAAFLRVPAA
jgi:hypothetical protein